MSDVDRMRVAAVVALREDGRTWHEGKWSGPAAAPQVEDVAMQKLRHVLGQWDAQWHDPGCSRGLMVASLLRLASEVAHVKVPVAYLKAAGMGAPVLNAFYVDCELLREAGPSGPRLLPTWSRP